MDLRANVAVVIPCYRVKTHILSVIETLGPEVSLIFVVDDACPQGTGEFVRVNCQDPRLRLLQHSTNQGVGAAVMTGYSAAIAANMDIIVKVDGDGQMDPQLIPSLIGPIVDGRADYTKGNRFFELEQISAMPRARLLGNAALSFMTKLSSGYWHLFDPTNGFTAIHSEAAKRLPFNKISSRYFFETDMLFRLNTLRAVVLDVPMHARYGDEVSNLKISKIVGEFAAKHLRNFCKRIFYNYYLRDMSLASIELPLGAGAFLFGIFFGGYHWLQSASSGLTASAGTVMLSALPVIIGLQLILAFLGYDIASVPTHSLQSLRHTGQKGTTDAP